jgi:hypothetical protein
MAKSKPNEIQEFLEGLREIDKVLRETVTPEFIAALDPAQAAWLLEHLEMLLEAERGLQTRIEELLARSRDAGA